MVNVWIVKKRMDYYRLYKRLLEMPVEETVSETLEYEVLARRYPYLAESIKLKKEMKRLEGELRSRRRLSTAGQTRTEITRIKVKLKKVEVSKRLYRETRNESLYNLRHSIGTLKARIFTLIGRANATLLEIHARTRRAFLSSAFDLRSLYAAEKGLLVKGWLHNHHKKPSKKLMSPVRSIKKVRLLARKR